jgi:hypothetical protein
VTDNPDTELVRRFRALGDNCEFGLVQRHYGAEPIDLLRFAGLHIPIEDRLAALTKAVTVGFEGLGQPGTFTVELGDPDGHGRREWYVQEHTYQLRWHTGRWADETDIEPVWRQQTEVAQFWRRSFVEDLQAASKPYVWKSNLPHTEVAIRGLLAALQAYGPNRLLWVDLADDLHPRRSVDDLGAGLFKGHIAKFAPYDRAWEIQLDDWMILCAQAADMIPGA